jgi:competence protein ComEA
MKNPLNDLFTPNEQKILVFLLFFAVLGLAFRQHRLIAEAENTELENIDLSTDLAVTYDLRNVTASELITIPGIGQKKAEDILKYREQNGFYSKSDLMKVAGIGQATYDKIESYFVDFGIAQPQTETKRTDKININTADETELCQLPGIGPARARQIILLREEQGSFSKVEDLLQIKGIGSKTLEKLKEKTTLGD